MNTTLKTMLGMVLTSALCATSAWSQDTSQASALQKVALPESPAKTMPLEDGPSTQANPNSPNVASNYAFTTTTVGSLTDMSTGTTQLLGADVDDTVSPITNIGFEFLFQGGSFTQFSVNENGSFRFGPVATPAGTPYQPLAVASQSKLTAYGADQRTHIGDGKVHYKVNGTAPNRVLVVEWLNTQSDFNAGGTADLTYQVRLFEGTGVIEYVYGAMALSTAGAADGNSNDPQIGFSSSNTAGTVGSVAAPQSGTPAPTFNGASATATNNLYTAGAIATLNSAANGARRVFTFTPPLAAAPTALNFTAVTAVSMTLNWTDTPTELSYAIYRSTDGITFSLAGTAAQNATTFAATGLSPSTNYTWRVVALTEGSMSPPLSGTQGTNPPGNIVSTAAGGNWSDPVTWVGGAVPVSTDNVTIANGATVTIDTAAVALSVVIGTAGAPAILQWDSAGARTLAVGGAITIASNGSFRTQEAGTVTTHNVTLAGSLINDGVLDFSTNADTAGAAITFTGATSNVFGGVGATTDVRAITLNKGAIANVLTLSASNFTVRGVSTDSAGFLTLTSGTLRISGTFSVTNRVFATPTYTIPATGGIWLDNPNFVVAGTASSTTTLNNGLFRITQGTYNIGLTAADGLGGTTGSFVIEGGTVNASGRIDPQGAVSYNQSGGTVNVAIVGNTRVGFSSFELFSATSSFTMSGGTINIINRNSSTTQVDYTVRSPLANTNISGGQIVFGATGAPASTTYRTTGGQIPSFTVNPTMTLDLNNAAVFLRGTTVVNNGTMTFTGANARFDFGSQTGAMSYGGTGVFGTALVPLAGVGISANSLFQTTLSAPIIVNRVNLFTGGFINSNQITLGNGGTSTTVVQTGSAGLATPGGSFDVSPVHNQGSGGQLVINAQESVARTTGFEINPTRVLTRLVVDNTNGLIIAGGDLEANATAISPNNALTLTNGRVQTGSNTLIVSAGAAVTVRTNGYVDGNFRKSYAAAGSKTFEVGTANGYSPVVANATAGTFPADVTVRAIQGVAPTIFPPADAITRHWNVTAPSVSAADLTFTYLDPADLATVTEADLVVFRRDGSTFTNLGGTLNTTANTGAVTGVTTFGVFTLAEAGVTSVEQADLQITKTDGVTTVTAGGSTTYTIVASNPSGPQGLVGATVADTFDSALTCTWSCVGSGGGTCTSSGSGNINDPVNLPVGGAVTYTATCSIALLASGSLVNTATVTVPAGAFDPNLANNSATDTDTIVAPQADLSITKSDSVTSVAPGQSTTYTITAGNSGPVGVTGATVTDTFPATLTGCAWTCTGSGGGTCANPSGTGNISELVNLPSGGSTTFAATCTVSPSASGTLANTATVAAPAGVTDPATGNNSATDTNTVQQTADVELLILNDVSYVQVGENVTLTVVVQNAGLSPAPSVAIAGVIPPELGFFSWSCVGLSGGVCGAPTGIGAFTTTANLPTGGAVLYTVQAKVLSEDASGGVSFSATATVGGSVVDPNLGNNTDSWDADVVLFRNGFDCTVGRGDCDPPASPPDYLTGFEAPDYTVGDVNAQQTWFAQFANWLVSTANPPEGAQAVRGLSDGLGSSFALSPTLPAGTETHSYASARIAINNTGAGATWRFAPQDTGAALVITRLHFVPGTNAIQVLQGNPSAYVTIPSVTWPNGTPFDIKVITRRADGEMQVCLNGTSIFTGTAISTTVNARDTRNVALGSLMEAGSTGSTMDFDEVVIDNTDTGGCAGPAAPRYELTGEAAGSPEAQTATAPSSRQ